VVIRSKSKFTADDSSLIIRSSASHTINRFLVPSQGSPSNSGNQFVTLLSSKKETKKRISFLHACGWVGLSKLDSSLVCWTIQVLLISDQILDCMVSGQHPRFHLADVIVVMNEKVVCGQVMLKILKSLSLKDNLLDSTTLFLEELQF